MLSLLLLLLLLLLFLLLLPFLRCSTVFCRLLPFAVLSTALEHLFRTVLEARKPTSPMKKKKEKKARLPLPFHRQLVLPFLRCSTVFRRCPCRCPFRCPSPPLPLPFHSPSTLLPLPFRSPSALLPHSPWHEGLSTHVHVRRTALARSSSRVCWPSLLLPCLPPAPLYCGTYMWYIHVVHTVVHTCAAVGARGAAWRGGSSIAASTCVHCELRADHRQVPHKLHLSADGIHAFFEAAGHPLGGATSPS